jgi:hypothetical protein
MDEGASMLRLLNLLEWPNNRTPELLCGPLHGAVAYFESHDTVPHEVALVYTLPAHSALVRCVVWRVNMLVHLINQAGVLAQYFPVQDRRGVLSRLQTCLDAMFPLLDKLEQQPALQLDEVYSQRLAPESTRQAVIDYSCTYFIRYLMPVVFGSKTDIPPIVLDILNCRPDDKQLATLIMILKHICSDGAYGRGFLSLVLGALRGEEAKDSWLSSLILTVAKYALLGNYPGAEGCAGFPLRREIYALSCEKLLHYFNACISGRETTREVEQGVVHGLLSTIFIGAFSVKSIDYAHLEFLAGEWAPFNSVNQRIVKLIINFYPSPTVVNLVTDIYRFSKPLLPRFENIFFAIADEFPLTSKEQWSFIHESGLVMRRLDTVLVPLVLRCTDPSVVEHLRIMQRFFDQNGSIWRPPTMHALLWGRLCSLATYLVERRTFAVIPGSQALFFEQAARLLKLTSKLSPEKTTVVYCNNCNTVRFRPVGIHLPASHITLLADLNFGRVHCVDCDSFDLRRINLLGRFVRCYLSNKKTRKLVTLALCSACLHVSVCGFYASKHGIICEECKFNVSTVGPPRAAKSCLSCGAAPSKLAHAPSYWSVIKDSREIESSTWCARCMPRAYARIREKHHVPLFNQKTLQQASHKPVARSSRTFK